MRRLNYDDYLFRCHTLGKLMTGIKIGLTEKQTETFSDLDKRYRGEGKPLTEKQAELHGDLLAKKTHIPELSETAKKELNKIHHQEFYGRTTHLTAKYLDKGLMVEDASISLYSELMNFAFFKNKERKSNDYITGEADNTKGKIRDIKSSWELSTFPMYEDKIANTDYYWQLQGYMALWEMDSSELIYCLVDTPFNLIEDEIRRLQWKIDALTNDGEIKKQHIPLIVELVQNHIFTNQGLKSFCHQSVNIELEWFEDFSAIPPELRVRTFEVPRDDMAIKALYTQIERARAYLNGLTDKVSAQLLIK